VSKLTLRKHTKGFTTISNSVVKVLKDDLESLGLYLFLLSLPNDWTFYKTNLCKECSVGIKKLEKLLKKLRKFGLVKYGQQRNNKGRFSKFYLDIYDIETIKINNIETITINNLEDNNDSDSPVGQNCRTVETVRRSGEAIKEELTKEELKTTKDIYQKPKKLAVDKKKKQKRKKVATEIPTSLGPTATHATMCESLGLDLEKEWFKFNQWHKAKGNLWVDWLAAFKNWLIKASEINEVWKKFKQTESKPYRGPAWTDEAIANGTAQRLEEGDF
jgi:hypothetical protein